MLIKKWKIRIQSDGRPAITFPSVGRMEFSCQRLRILSYQMKA